MNAFVVQDAPLPENHTFFPSLFQNTHIWHFRLPSFVVSNARAGERVFDAIVEGTTIPNIDVAYYTEQSTIEDFREAAFVTVYDLCIPISFTSKVGSPMLSGIEILPDP